MSFHLTERIFFLFPFYSASPCRGLVFAYLIFTAASRVEVGGLGAGRGGPRARAALLGMSTAASSSPVRGQGLWHGLQGRGPHVVAMHGRRATHGHHQPKDRFKREGACTNNNGSIFHEVGR